MTNEERAIMKFKDLHDKIAWLNKLKLEGRFELYKASEMSCIEYIGNHKDSNVTKIADSFYMTRGALSKITKKLIQKGIIESYQKDENKKEIYFRLTDEGRKVYNIHEEMHNKFIERDSIVFEQITDQQFEHIFRFMENYDQHLNAEIRKMGIDIESE